MNTFKITAQEIQIVVDLHMEVCYMQSYDEVVTRHFKNKKTDVIYCVGYDANREWDDTSVAIYGSNGRAYHTEFTEHDWENREHYAKLIEHCFNISHNETDWVELVID